MQKSDNNPRKYILLLILIIIILLIFYFINSNKTDSQKQNTNTQESPVASPSNTSEAQAESNLPIEFIIDSPEGEIFSTRQARMWRAKLNNFKSEYGVLADCNWKFYLDRNNGEALYKEMTGRAVLSTDGNNSCAFTSTFIEEIGKLRAEVTITIPDNLNNTQQTYTAERSYVVQ